MGVSDNNIHRFGIEWKSTQVEFFIDDTSKGTITTNLPDSPLCPMPFWMLNSTACTAGADAFICDYWHYIAT